MPEIATPDANTYGAAYQAQFGLAPPRLEDAVGHREAKPFALLQVALLEAGGPLTLEQAAARFEQAGAGTREQALRSLKRSRPDRPPVYRHGELYHLDPYDHELDMTVFLLGLRPSKRDLEAERREAAGEPPLPEVLADEDEETRSRRWDEDRDRRALPFLGMRRALLHGFPFEAPEAVALWDVDTERQDVFLRDDFPALTAVLDDYDILGAVDIRPLLDGLGYPHAARRLHELRPPQKTIRYGARGKVLKIGMEDLLRGSCGIRRQWGRPAPLAKLLDAERYDALLERLERELSDLAQLYRYGRLRGLLRFRWRQMDEDLRVPWVHWDEHGVWRYLERAREAGQPLAVVAGDAPDPTEPWLREDWYSVYRPADGHHDFLVSADRQVLDLHEVQRLRFTYPGAWHAPLPAEAAGPSRAIVPPTGPSHVLRLRITLPLEDLPPVWRRIELDAEGSFWDLHVAIQDAMGWTDSHLHEFRLLDPESERTLRIGLPFEEFLDEEPTLQGWLLPLLAFLGPEQPRCVYEYDFGDGWKHEIELEALDVAEPGRAYPRLLDGERACPPEDVGGPYMYGEFLKALRDPSHEEHELNVTWIGGSFDPEAFDPDAPRFQDPGERWVAVFGVS